MTDFLDHARTAAASPLRNSRATLDQRVVELIGKETVSPALIAEIAAETESGPDDVAPAAALVSAAEVPA